MVVTWHHTLAKVLLVLLIVALYPGLKGGMYEVMVNLRFYRPEIYPYAMEASNVGLRFMSKTIFILDLL